MEGGMRSNGGSWEAEGIGGEDASYPVSWREG